MSDEFQGTSTKHFYCDLREMAEVAGAIHRIAMDPSRRPMKWVRWITPETTPEAKLRREGSVIHKTEVPDGYVYRLEGTNAEVRVDAEVGGHGCLFGIHVPSMSVAGASHAGDPTLPDVHSVMAVLNRVFKDYHCRMVVVEIPMGSTNSVDISTRNHTALGDIEVRRVL